MTHRATKRYAAALFNLAMDTGKLDAVGRDMAALQRLVDTSAAFRHFLAHPLIPDHRRREALAALFRDRFDPLTLTFLELLVEKERLPLLAEICACFTALRDDAQGIMKVTLRSAHPLSRDQVARVRARLRHRYARTVEVRTAVDASLLGGFVVEAGDHIHDAGVRTMLDNFKQRLLHAAS